MNRAQRRNIGKSRDPKELATLAELHHRHGRLGQAERKYREAIAQSPAYVDAHNNLGMVLMESGRLVEATAQFVRTVELRPTDARLVFNLARALSAQNRLEEAAPIYRRSIALSPSFADAHFGLALNLAQSGKHREAELSYVTALQIDPLNWQARIHLGLTLVDQGKVVDALAQAEILARAEAASDFPHKAFGILLARANCPEGARACFETHLARNRADADEVAMLLAAVGGALPERATDRQVRQIYLSRADGWDNGAGARGYQGHRLVADALDEIGGGPVDTILDAGCGTGLVGERVRARARQLVGIDMSEPMLAQARQKNLYDVLHRGDLLDYLSRHPKSCDIIASAATLVHFGELDSVFEAAAGCLRAGGLLACTLFPNDDDPDAVAIGTLNGLAQGGCFRHGSAYVTRTAAKHGFHVEALRRAPHEYVGGAPIDGLIVVLRLSA